MKNIKKTRDHLRSQADSDSFHGAAKYKAKYKALCSGTFFNLGDFL